MDVFATSYGADEAGLICGFLFRPHGEADFETLKDGIHSTRIGKQRER